MRLEDELPTVLYRRPGWRAALHYALHLGVGPGLLLGLAAVALDAPRWLRKQPALALVLLGLVGLAGAALALAGLLDLVRAPAVRRGDVQGFGGGPAGREPEATITLRLDSGDCQLPRGAAGGLEVGHELAIRTGAGTDAVLEVRTRGDPLQDRF